eukprot:scaffold2621_cov344-Prasinococcus_capsulatus_cf.AAC.6
MPNHHHHDDDDDDDAPRTPPRVVRAPAGAGAAKGRTRRQAGAEGTSSARRPAVRPPAGPELQYMHVAPAAVRAPGVRPVEWSGAVATRRPVSSAAAPLLPLPPAGQHWREGPAGARVAGRGFALGRAWAVAGGAGASRSGGE